MCQLEPSFRIDVRHFGLVVSTSLSGEVVITLDLAAQLLKRLELALQAIGDFHQPMTPRLARFPKLTPSGCD